MFKIHQVDNGIRRNFHPFTVFFRFLTLNNTSAAATRNLTKNMRSFGFKRRLNNNTEARSTDITFDRTLPVWVSDLNVVRQYARFCLRAFTHNRFERLAHIPWIRRLACLKAGDFILLLHHTVLRLLKLLITTVRHTGNLIAQ